MKFLILGYMEFRDASTDLDLHGEVRDARSLARALVYLSEDPYSTEFPRYSKTLVTPPPAFDARCSLIIVILERARKRILRSRATSLDLSIIHPS